MIPCYFDMLLEEAPLALVFKIPRQVIERYEMLTDDLLINMAQSTLLPHRFFDKLRCLAKKSDSPGLFDDYFRACDLREARGLFGDYFGLGRTIVIEDRGEDFWTLRAVIPEGFVFTDKVCPVCQGTKIDPNDLEDYYLERPCASCSGSGLVARDQHILIWELANNISLLLDMVRIMIYHFAEPLNNKRPMLMFLQTGIEGYGRQFVGGYFTEELNNFLQAKITSGQSDTLAAETSQKMYQAFNFMEYGLNESRYDKSYDFITHIYNVRDTWDKEILILLVQVPGVNGCNVYVDDGRCFFSPTGSDDNTYNLTCHNTDNPTQQIALLVGLAHLCSSARTKKRRRGSK